MQTVERIETVISLPKDLLEQANEINKDEKFPMSSKRLCAIMRQKKNAKS